MAIPFATLLPQLIGAGTSLAAAVPNARDKQNRRIAMGGEDPALQAIRAQLSAQNATNARMAMSIAANQQGVNPALAQRNAVQALAPAMAQQQMQTNAEMARLGVNSAMQARQTDSKGQKISAALSGIGQFANVLGTGLATQNAGMDAAGTPSVGDVLGAPGKAIGGLVKGALGKVLGGGSPTPAPAFSGSNYTAPAPTTFGTDLPAEAQMPVGADGQPLFDVDAPSAAAGVPSGHLQPSGQTGSGVGGLGTFQTPPAATPAAPVAPLPMPGLQLPQSNQVPASQVLGGAAAPQPTGPSPQGQMVPGQGAGPAGGNLGPQSRGVPSLEGGNPGIPEPQFRPSDALPPQVVSNPENNGLLQFYDEAVARGDTDLASILEGILHTNALGTY